MTDHRTDRQLNALAAAMGKALGATKRELRDEYKAELDAMIKRIEHLERGRRGAKILDARDVFGKGRASG